MRPLSDPVTVPFRYYFTKLKTFLPSSFLYEFFYEVSPPYGGQAAPRELNHGICETGVEELLIEKKTFFGDFFFFLECRVRALTHSVS